MSTCTYPGCTSTDINVYELCSEHYRDYGNVGHTIQKVQELLRNMSKTAPKSTGDTDFQNTVFKKVILAETGIEEKQEKLL